MHCLLIFSKIPRPCFTASTIVAKLSSVIIISAAPFATSVPEIPHGAPNIRRLERGGVVYPVSGHGNHGPCRWKALTIRTLCSGEPGQTPRIPRSAVPVLPGPSHLAAHPSWLCRVPPNIPNSPGDGFRCDNMIPCDHNRPDPGLFYIPGPPLSPGDGVGRSYRIIPQKAKDPVPNFPNYGQE